MLKPGANIENGSCGDLELPLRQDGGEAQVNSVEADQRAASPAPRQDSVPRAANGNHSSLAGWASSFAIRAVANKPPKIGIHTARKIVFVNLADVAVVEAQGNYVSLQTSCRAHLLRESISAIAAKLKPYGFLRIHRSTIVNQESVEEIRVAASGDMFLRVTGKDKEYSVSRKYRHALKSIAPCWI
jgi:DNA-binding LytR/AlgR family response regulator